MSYSYVAHGGLDYCNPLSPETMEHLLDRLELQPGRRVLDLGGGTGELCLRIIEAYHARATLVDRSPEFCTEARDRAGERSLQGRLKVVEQDALDYLDGFGGKVFDLGICFGASHAFGGLRGTLNALQSVVNPHGLLLVGQAYWKHAPDPEFLAFLGAQEDDLSDHAGNVALGVERGLIPLHAIAATDRESDDYEWWLTRNVEVYAAERPEDEQAQRWLARARGWRDAYLHWGRATLGFGAYLFRNG